MTTRPLALAKSYVDAVNNHAPAALIALFADDARVDDAGREFRGLDAIKSWSDREIFAANVTLDILDESEQGGEAVITTQVEGNFDRTGLPDPVIITHRFAVEDDRIAELTCRLASVEAAQPSRDPA